MLFLVRVSADGDAPPLVLKASYGLNHFVVKALDIVQQQYPAHAKAATLYGRLASKGAVVNVNMRLDYNETVGSVAVLAFCSG